MSQSSIQVTSQVLHTPQSPSKQSTAPPASQAAPPSEPAILGMVFICFYHLFMVIWGIDYGCFTHIEWYFWHFLATSGCTENIE
jgi:hypothetical protein